MKYPTRNGLVISPYEIFDIPTKQDLNTRRRTTRHHAYWQRNDYRDNRIHSVFRNLVTNVYDLLQDQHENLHHDFDAPPKPKDSLMIDVVEEYLSLNGTIDCIREKRTHEIYQLTSDQWASIRGAHGLQQMDSRGNGVLSSQSRSIYQRAS